MKKILMVEDSPEVSMLVTQLMLREGIEVVVANSIHKAKSLVKDGDYVCFLVDLTLPDGDGFELCTEIKRNKNLERVPIFIFTGHDDLVKKISAFSIGIDDYMVKPMNFVELRYRIIERIKKNQELQGQHNYYSVGDFIIDTIRQEISLKTVTKSLVYDFSAREFKIMSLLLKHPNSILSREQILNNVMLSGVNVSDRTIDTHICNIRKKLGSLGHLIESVSGVGYRFHLQRDKTEEPLIA